MYCRQSIKVLNVSLNSRAKIKKIDLINDFHIFQPKHMMWVLKSTISMKQFLSWVTRLIKNIFIYFINTQEKKKKLK